MAKAPATARPTRGAAISHSPRSISRPAEPSGDATEGEAGACEGQRSGVLSFGRGERGLITPPIAPGVPPASKQRPPSRAAVPTARGRNRNRSIRRNANGSRCRSHRAHLLRRLSTRSRHSGAWQAGARALAQWGDTQDPRATRSRESTSGDPQSAPPPLPASVNSSDFPDWMMRLSVSSRPDPTSPQ
jgi:hypothetical protein